jgi:hypothetical protein
MNTIIVRGHPTSKLFVAKLFTKDAEGNMKPTSFESSGRNVNEAIGNLLLGPADGLSSLRGFMEDMRSIKCNAEFVGEQLLKTARSEKGCAISIEINTLENWPVAA